MYKVLTPIKVGPMELKNRVQFLAMAKCLGNMDFTISDKQVAYYEAVAKGGAGLITPGAAIAFPEYPSVLPMQPGVFDDKFIPGLKRLADAVHKHGAKIIMQPWHPGETPYFCAPDAVKKCADWTVDELHAMQKRWVECAVRMQKAGIDGIEMHVAHNYLLEQFVVPLYNKRTDEYGAQNMENGLRFTTEIMQMVREACGPDFAITVKINGDDFNPDGMTDERLAQVGPILEKAGAQMISVSAGGSLTDSTGMSGDGFREEGWKVRLAEIVKKTVSIPVMATGSIRHPEYVEQILSEGKCDMIGMGRGLVAEPEWCNKLAEGREDEMAYCISCMGCGTGCSVNPVSLREYLNLTAEKNGDGKQVVVVGAGPAGMQAAKTLAERGFKVTLFEKENEVGGLERLASKPIAKYKLGWHIEYLEKQIKRLGVDIRLGTEATAEEILAMNPHGVIIAAGSIATYPKSIPGIDKAHVVESRDILPNLPQTSGENVVVVGAGLVGIETGMDFASKGNKVDLIDVLPPLDPTKTASDVMLAYGHALGFGVQFHMEHKLLEITDDSVIAENMQTGEKLTLKADRVVLCMGSKPNNALYEALEGKVERLYNVGDSKEAAKIQGAIKSAYDAAIDM